MTSYKLSRYKVKDFSNFTFIQFVDGGQQWQKRYESGEIALMVIYTTRPSRKDIAVAFEEQEIQESEAQAIRELGF